MNIKMHQLNKVLISFKISLVPVMLRLRLVYLCVFSGLERYSLLSIAICSGSKPVGNVEKATLSWSA